MKKIVISFILLVIAGTAVFVIGLVHIPREYYGVIQTKFSGLDEKVYLPDSWVWRWEKLFPTVFTLYKFTLSPEKKELDSPIKGSLFPSGNDYAKALGESFNFSFELKINVEFVITPEKLPLLVKDGLLPENLPAWQDEISGKLSVRMSEIVLKEPDIFMKYRQQEFLDHIQAIIGDDKDFYGITLLNLDPVKINIPDYDAYKFVKEKYLEHLAIKTAIRNEMLQAEKQLYLEAVQKEIEIIRNIDKYGEILTKYPSILEFLQKTNKGYIQENINTSE